MPKRSAGILLYRRSQAGLEVLLVHPGGPFWRNKDTGAWSIPKGEYSGDEDALVAARREFAEETGMSVDGEFLPLGELAQGGGKVVTAFALAGEFEPPALKSNTFTLEWPPRSGRMAMFPEVDRAQWFSPAEADARILKGQREFIARLRKAIGD